MTKPNRHPRTEGNSSPRLFLTGILLILLLGGCHKFETNPYDTENVSDLPTDLNARNFSRLREQPLTDTVTVMFIGDTQRFYDALNRLVDIANGLEEIDFLVMAGDITDFGLGTEFRWIYERLSRLHVPYFCVIGNHDLVAKGGEIYDRVFGPRNFSFRYGPYKFIFHDTNGREYGFQGNVPDLSYLRTELSDSAAKRFILLSHVPPFNEDFDPALNLPYTELLSSEPRVLVSLHGHLHNGNRDYRQDGHVKYIVAPAVKTHSAFLLRFWKDGMSLRTLSY